MFCGQCKFLLCWLISHDYHKKNQLGYILQFKWAWFFFFRDNMIHITDFLFVEEHIDSSTVRWRKAAFLEVWLARVFFHR